MIIKRWSLLLVVPLKMRWGRGKRERGKKKNRILLSLRTTRLLTSADRRVSRPPGLGLAAQLRGTGLSRHSLYHKGLVIHSDTTKGGADFWLVPYPRKKKTVVEWNVNKHVFSNGGKHNRWRHGSTHVAIGGTGQGRLSYHLHWRIPNRGHHQ